MDNKQIICGIDIGTTKIAVVIAEWIESKGQINILGAGESSSHGMKKGVVVNMNSTIESLSAAISIAEKQADVEVEK